MEKEILKMEEKMRMKVNVLHSQYITKPVPLNQRITPPQPL